MLSVGHEDAGSDIVIKSFNGLGDLLLATPTLRVVKEAVGSSVRLKINTNFPGLLIGNPYVDEVGGEKQGLFLAYPDPIHMKKPHRHHIYTDWRVICTYLGITTRRPWLRPEYYGRRIRRTEKIGVQVRMTGKYGGKKDWTGSRSLIEKTGWEPIPNCSSPPALAVKLSSYKAIVCTEGGVHHLAAAVGTPAVVLFGGFISPEWTGYQYQFNVVNRLECSEECYDHHKCKNTKILHQCWREISPADVQKAMEMLLNDEESTGNWDLQRLRAA